MNLRFITPIITLVPILSLVAGARPAIAQAGSLDPAFGHAGIVETNFGPLNDSFVTNDFSFSDAALAPSGDILVAGSVTGLDGQQETAVIVRYLPSGAEDASFASGGVLTLPAPASFNLGSSFTLSVTVQADNKILSLFVATDNAGTQSEILLQRFDSNGQPDPTFGSDGHVAVNFPAPPTFAASPNLVLAQPNGKILLAGSATPPFRSKLPAQTVLARYLSDGALDTTFGTGGFVSKVAVGSPSAVALLSSGSILAVNSIGQVADFAAPLALSLTTNGLTVIATKQTGAAAFLSNGDYVITGTTGGPLGRRNLDAKITRFLPNGTVDPTFSSPAISFGANGRLVQSEPVSIGVDSQGRASIGGIFITPTNGIFGVARVTSTGSLDTTFGTGGTVTTQVALEGSVFEILVQPDNKIVAIGEVQVSKTFPGTTEGLGIARYLAK